MSAPAKATACPRGRFASRISVVLLTLAGMTVCLTTGTSAAADGPVPALPTPTALPSGGTPTPPPPPINWTPPDPKGALMPTMSPNQPAIPSPSCQFAPLGATEFRAVYAQVEAPPQSQGWISPPAVDPWSPCRVYRGNDSSGGDTTMLQRVTQPPFQVDTVLTLPQGYGTNPVQPGQSTLSQPNMLYLSQPVVPAPGKVLTYDVYNHWGIFDSLDAGYHWTQEPPQPAARALPYSTTAEVRANDPLPGDNHLVFAPGDPSLGYFYPTVAGAQQVFGLTATATPLYRTSDGGATWQPLTFPGTSIAGMAIDSRNAAHAFAITSTGLLFETVDRGLTWTPSQGPSVTNDTAVELLCSHSAAGVTLYAGFLTSSRTVVWMQSRAGGGWVPLPLPALGTIDSGHLQNSLAVDPYSDVAVWAGQEQTAATAAGQPLTMVVTRNAFATAVQRELLAPSFDLADTSPAGFQELTVQLDRADDVFLWEGAEHAAQRGASSPLVGLSSALYAFSMTAFAGSPAQVIRLGMPSTTGGLSDGAAAGGTTNTHKPIVPPAGSPRSSSTSCTLATTLSAGATPVPVPGTPQDDPTHPTSRQLTSSGSLAYDGRYLDYTVNPLDPGMIGRVDPATCALQPTLALRPQDFPNGQLPNIEELTYDPQFRNSDGTIGALLIAGDDDTDPRVPSGATPIYAVNPLTGESSPPLLHFFRKQDPQNDTGQGDPYLAFDFFDGALWSEAPQLDGSTGPGKLTFDGRSVPTCMTNFANNVTEPSGEIKQRDAVTWAIGGQHTLYVQLEDDKTVLRVDSATCQIIDSFAHPTFGEPLQEDEQLACDPITFSRVPGVQGSVLWIRDSASNSATAFPIPDGYCPFPTSLSFVSPTVAASGTQVPLCAQLSTVVAGVRETLAAESIRFSVEGRDVGSALTDRTGTACVRVPNSFALGQTPAQADFDGTRAYMPARAVTGTPPALTVFGLVVGGLISGGGNSALNSLPPASAPAAYSSAAAPAAQAQAEAQAQAQSQAGTQSVAQAQPGFMVQRQKRVQMATQEMRTETTQTQYQATALRRPRPSPAPAVAVGLMVIGLAMGTRRSRWAAARAWRRVSSPSTAGRLRR